MNAILNEQASGKSEDKETLSGAKPGEDLHLLWPVMVVGKSVEKCKVLAVYT